MQHCGIVQDRSLLAFTYWHHLPISVKYNNRRGLSSLSAIRSGDGVERGGLGEHDVDARLRVPLEDLDRVLALEQALVALV
jgi:hypothetical protein